MKKAHHSQGLNLGDPDTTTITPETYGKIIDNGGRCPKRKTLDQLDGDRGGEGYYPVDEG